MAINYERELIKLIEGNKIQLIPSQEVIDNNEKVAQALWSSFKIDVHYYYDESESDFTVKNWYIKGNWGNVFAVYKFNITFWEKCINANNFKYEILLLLEFQKDFPIITNYFLQNNEFLINIFNETKNIEFYKLLKLDTQELIQIEKDYLIENWPLINKENFKKYENDTDFVKGVLYNVPHYYAHLSHENKKNNELIEIALFEEKSSLTIFNYLQKEKQEEFFDTWLNFYLDKIKFEDLNSLNRIQVRKVIEKRKDLLIEVLYNKPYEYEHMVMDLLKKDFNEFIAYVDSEIISNLFHSNHDIIPFKNELNQAINSYTGKPKNRKERNILFLIQLDSELWFKLRNTIVYKVHKLTSLEEDLTEEEFIVLAKEIKKEYENQNITTKVMNDILKILIRNANVYTFNKFQLQDSYNFIENFDINK